MSQVPSILPSSTSSPTVTCYWIEVTIDASFQHGTNWEIYRLVDSDNKEEVKSHLYTASDKELTCLEEGEYEFVIRGSVNPRLGDCDFKEGDYTITTLDGIKIDLQNVIEGGGGVVGRCDFSDSTYFSIPYSTTPSPTLSLSPTWECSIWIKITIVYDDFPDEISWELHKLAVNDNDKALVNSQTASRGDTSYSTSICLPEGEYQFTIYDRYDGILPPGHYNVTSDGNRIVQGGEFGLGEVTSFSLPYVPGSSTLTNVTQEPTTPYVETPFPTTTPTITSRPQTPFPTYSPTTVPASDSSPVSSPDSASVSTGDQIFVSVLDNDTPVAGETLEVTTIITQAWNGECSISLDLYEVVYVSNLGFSGVDTCVYEACDSVWACDTATLTLTVVVTSQMTEACEDIMTRKDCTKSTNNCIWDTTVEGGPVCVSSES